ncbi:MAG TPA: mechanosensitive ion channel family protein, partial [Bacillota bacterium]|nr:mechanosensitive ion channel family protein [Bacillota bacterium]
GLAIGFGAQSLVKDVIAGFFIIFEDHFSVGDYIEIGYIEGDVEVIGLRSTKLRSYYGQVYVIPNGKIDIVTNYSMTNGFAMVEINVPYETDILTLEKTVENILATLPEKYDFFIGTPEINGVQALELSNYVLRIRAETTPVMQWAGARAIRKEVKEHLFEKGIEIPSPRIVVYSNDEDRNEDTVRSEAR